MTKPGTIRQKNPKWLKRLVGRYGNDKVLAVGWPAGPAAGIRYPGGADGKPGAQVAYVAAINNKGSVSRHIPARPFMEEGALDAVDAIKPIHDRLLRKLNEGKLTVEQMLEHMGPFAVGAFKKRIKGGPWVANAKSTIEVKGSDTPLIDTGLLVQSITYAVRKK